MPRNEPRSAPQAKTSRPGPTARTASLEQLSDAELVGRCAANDQMAWRTLVRRYQRLVYTVPYRMGLDPADADDVFQLTFSRLAQRIDSLKEPSKVRAWLVTTARRIAMGAATRRRAAEDSEEILSRLADPAELPADELDRLEEQQLVRVSLARLSAKCRELLTLLYYAADSTVDAFPEGADSGRGVPVSDGVPPKPDPAASPGGRDGVSYDAAARVLGVPVGSIGPTRMRCLKKLLVEYRKTMRERGG